MVGAQEFFCVHLNILDEQKVWDRLEGLYRDLPGWQGFVKGCPLWRMDGGSIQGSVDAAVLPVRQRPVSKARGTGPEGAHTRQHPGV